MSVTTHFLLAALSSLLGHLWLCFLSSNTQWKWSSAGPGTLCNVPQSILVSNLLSTGHMCPKVAINVAHHRILNLKHCEIFTPLLIWLRFWNMGFADDSVVEPSVGVSFLWHVGNGKWETTVSFQMLGTFSANPCFSLDTQGCQSFFIAAGWWWQSWFPLGFLTQVENVGVPHCYPVGKKFVYLGGMQSSITITLQRPTA